MLILALLTKGYFLVAFFTLMTYLMAFLRDSSTSKADRQSWIVIGLAAPFWPVVLPLSYLERRANRAGLQSYEMTSLDTLTVTQYSFSYSLSNSPMAEHPEVGV